MERPLLDDAGWGVGNHALIAFGPRIAIRISGSRSSQRSQGRARDLDQESDTSFERSSARGDLRGKTGGIVASARGPGDVKPEILSETAGEGQPS